MAKALRRLHSYAKVISRYAKYSSSKTPVFVVGFQRSGTTMILNVMKRSPRIHAIGEGDGIVMEAKYYRLISDKALKKTIFRTPEPIIIFKPLNDSQNVDRMLRIHAASKAIWVYRDYHDLISSAVKLFGNEHRQIIYEINKGLSSHPGRGAFAERVSEVNLVTLKRFLHNNLSPHDGAALVWYLRNWIYFDLKLKDRSNVIICKYEDLVLKPTIYFKRLFDFVGADFLPEFVEQVHSRSVKKKETIVINRDIERLCEKMLDRLNKEYTKQIVAIS
jgi:hypothetical protein